MSYRNEKEIDIQIRKSVNEKVKKAINKSINIDYVDTLKDRIVKRTQLGIGVDPSTGNSYKLPPLSQNYKETRQGKARFYTDKAGNVVKVTKNKNNKDYVKKPRLASTTTPAKSNLTATGQLLKSLTTVKSRFQGGVAYIIRVGDKRGRGLFNTPPTIGNKQLVKYLASQGRNFLGFTKSQKNQITREIRQIIIKFLR
tara:strand:+ start:12546 stop:13139 length:594 start_codon:yes stop_codon:yes gene_type:complete